MTEHFAAATCQGVRLDGADVVRVFADWSQHSGRIKRGLTRLVSGRLSYGTPRRVAAAEAVAGHLIARWRSHGLIIYYRGRWALTAEGLVQVDRARDHIRAEVRAARQRRAAGAWWNRD